MKSNLVSYVRARLANGETIEELNKEFIRRQALAIEERNFCGEILSILFGISLESPDTLKPSLPTPPETT